ncbi:MAG: hypothetical protein GY804_00540 [Alphaproteobacteria bacterium]|nr:hypothetical protein [Alphaproteobacteria bacterium]
MEDKLIGTPIPITFGPVIKAPAYKTGTNTWKFADTTFNAIDSTIIVYNDDDTIFTHGGTITDGTFTGTETGTEADNKLKVSFTQSAVQNGLDVIADIMQNYENIAFSALNYDLVEWNQGKTGVANMGLWLGKGNIKSTVDVIEQVCTDNQGIFEPLADGRNTFRTYNPGKMPTHEIFQDELLSDPSRKYDSEEFLSSVTVEYAKDIKAKDPQMYTNSSLEHEVFGRYRQRKGKIYKTALTTEADALTLTNDVMALSKFILPTIGLKTKIQNISLRILDNVMYEHKRQNGKIIIPQSKYQTLGVGLNLTTFEMSITEKQIEEDNTTYRILDGGTPETDYDYYDGGTPSARPTKIYRGRTF